MQKGHALNGNAKQPPTKTTLALRLDPTIEFNIG